MEMLCKLHLIMAMKQWFCDVMAVSHVSESSHVTEIAVANSRWHCQQPVASQVIWISIYSVHSSHRKSDCFYPNKGTTSQVRLLMEKGAKINAQGGYFGNALQAASRDGHEAVVRLLLEKGEISIYREGITVMLYKPHPIMVTRRSLNYYWRAGYMLIQKEDILVMLSKPHLVMVINR